MKYTYCALTPQMWKAKIADIGECRKIDMEKEESRMEGSAICALCQLSFSFNFVFSRAKQPFPLWGRVLRALASNAPGGLLLGRGVAHFFMPMKKATKFFRGVSYAPEKNVAFRR